MKWLFFFPLSLFAVYVGNPANPAIMNTGFFSSSYPFVKGTSGYIYDFTPNKYYEAEQPNSNFDPTQIFKEMAIRSQLASFSLILIERMELFGSAGGSKEEARGSTTASIFEDFQTEYHFSWSAGTKIVLIQWGTTYLSCDFTYFAIPESSKSFFKFLNRLNLPIDFTKHNLALREWQFSGALSSKIFFVTPYIGMTYLSSHLHIDATSETGPIEYKNRYTFGWFYGFTISLTGRFHFNFEQRLRDELG
ncbi:MAG: hypothetical protein FJZ64_03080, partial [Chlamydiae bacterium]|nr:hypothetical protein [Chlamydiota bacterium]